MQEQPKDDKGKTHSIVQARLPGQAETHRVFVLGIGHLHQCRKHWVCGCEDRPDQHRNTPFQVQAVVQHQRYATDAHHHHRPCQVKRGQPSAVMQGQAQLQTAEEQRKKHRDLGQVLHPFTGLADIQMKKAQPGRSEPDAQGKAHHRGCHRHPA
ncbi:hypothetical protein D3C79_713080 [compost metagenome]